MPWRMRGQFSGLFTGTGLLGLLLLAQFGLAQPGDAPDQRREADQQQLIDHDLEVFLDPANHYLQVRDVMSFPPAYRGRTLNFRLNSNLRLGSSSLEVQPLSLTDSSEQVATTAVQAAASRLYEVTLPNRGEPRLTLEYSGTINDLAEQDSPEYAQSFAESSGIIDARGVFLSRASRWVPDFGEHLLSFQLQTRFAPSAASWTAVSQGRLAEPGAGRGRGGRDSLWIETRPMEEIYLIAAEFTVYSRQAADTAVLAYLRSPDENLATRYMDATARYLALYEPLLGEYPYSKFALVENFWETGYGMPSFTLLGEQVLRLPFILETSYPHEILHNWWGNGVYPDYETGNWSEGLTAYLADHLFDEMDGLGHEYRKEMLARYRNYVAEDSDFPLSRFTSRNSAATQAVGYGKTLMLWHMLRIELGDELFLEGLRTFYRDYRFQRASWADIEALFSELSGRDLAPFFRQWVERTGAPALSVDVEEVNGNQARIMFAQIQSGPAYELTVPVALFYEGESEPRLYNISLTQKVEGVMAGDYSGLQAVLVDPYFDVFRSLDREETPPTIGELFGAGVISFVLPDDNPEHWRQMAEAFAGNADAEILLAGQLESLPADRPVWVLGRDNPFAGEVVQSTFDYGVRLTATGFTLDERPIPFANRSTVLVGRHPADPDLAVGLIHVEEPVALPGMIEKLPHYGKYSYLSFTGAEPTNDIKGIWSSPDSPMLWQKAGTGISLENLPELPPLATLPPKYLPAGLQKHVSALTGSNMEGRGLGSAGLQRAANYIAGEFHEAGLEMVAGRYQHSFSATVEGQDTIELINVVGLLKGSNPELARQPVIVGAHYDHLGIDAGGTVFPGADDNASGVSIMLEVAAYLQRSYTPERPVLFVAFSGEEAGLLGSRQFVAEPPAPFTTDQLYAMVNLDAVGRLEGRPLQVFASDSAYEWPFMAQGIGFTIGLESTFPAQTVASSDHVPFLNAGIAAIHLFSGTHSDYHRSTDTAGRLDIRGMSDVARWLEEAVMYLGSNTEPLRVTLDGAAPVQISGESSAREASLGTVPDFAHTGPGVGISAVAPGSAAAAAGLQAGDVLRSFNGEPVTDLQAYSNLLRAAAPGDRVILEVARDGRLMQIEATLRSR